MFLRFQPRSGTPDPPHLSLAGRHREYPDPCSDARVHIHLLIRMFGTFPRGRRCRDGFAELIPRKYCRFLATALVKIVRIVTKTIAQTGNAASHAATCVTPARSLHIGTMLGAIDEARLYLWACRAIDQDYRAFEHLHAEVTPQTWRALSPWADSADIEDAVQEAWVAVLSGKARYDRARPFLPWFTGVARKKLQALRRKRRLAGPHDGIDDYAAGAAEDQLELADRCLRVVACWDKLADRDQERIRRAFPDAPRYFLTALEQVNAAHIRALFDSLPTYAEIADEVG